MNFPRNFYEHSALRKITSTIDSRTALPHFNCITNFGGYLYEDQAMALPPGTKANTGEKCPQGGIWHPVGNSSEARSIGIGNIMPPTPKKETHWVLKTATGNDEGTTKTQSTQTKAKIGEKCPQGGTWHPVGNTRDTRSIGINNIMPPTPNGEAYWVLKNPTGDK